MDLFDIPDDYVSKNPLSDAQMSDITTYLQNHPLFMKQLPANIQDNQHLVALQNLQDFQDTNVSAQSLLKQGNDILSKNQQNKHYLKSAYDKYTEGINLKPEDKWIMARLHCNRALINLKTKNYGKVIVDTKIAIKLNHDYTKAYYRCAQALIAINRYKQVIQLLNNRQEKQLEALRNQTMKEIEKQKKELLDRKQQKSKDQIAIQSYCKQKSYKLIKRTQPLPQGAQLTLSGVNLSIPILFFYPQFSQMDLIAKSCQQQKIRTYLKQLFQSSLPWDNKKQYNEMTVQLYCQLGEDKLMKVPKQAKIMEIAKRVIIKGALEILILAKDNKFYQAYLNNKHIL